CSASSPAGARASTSTPAATSRSATATTSAIRRSSPPTGGWPTTTSRPTATTTSAPAGSRTSTSSSSTGSPRPTSTGCSSRRSARPTRPTSTSASPPTCAGSWVSGCASRAESRRPSDAASAQLFLDPRGAHRLPLVGHGMGEQDEVAQLAVAVADVVAQQALGLEAERLEHRHGAVLLGDHLDDQLAQPRLDRLDQRPAREVAADPRAPVVGRDDEAHLADVVRPADKRDDRDVAGHRAVLAGDRAGAGAVAQPALDGGAVEHLLLEERALVLGDAGEELEQRVGVVGAQ